MRIMAIALEMAVGHRRIDSLKRRNPQKLIAALDRRGNATRIIVDCALRLASG
jgi:hypothetical protein